MVVVLVVSVVLQLILTLGSQECTCQCAVTSQYLIVLRESTQIDSPNDAMACLLS